jgi:branched-chain amino acid transport system permease protein
VSWVNALIQGILVGGLYALFATGLSVTFGVMRLVNLSHGDWAVVAAFASSTIVLATGWYPFWTLLLLVPIGFLVGVAIQRLAFDRLVGVDPAYQIVATFGIAIILQNLLLSRYGANVRGLDVGSLSSSSITITDDLSIGWFTLLRFLVAVAVLGVLSLFFARTRLGRAFRATADDPLAARLVGVNPRVVYAVATGIAFATVAIAGVFNGAQTTFSAASGPELLIYAFEVVVIGGLGSLWGTLAGGIVLGVAQNLGAEWNVEYKQLVGHLVFLAVLVVRPTGLFGVRTTT